MEILESTLRLATPLVFAALGGVLSERAGVVNIALEGKLLVGAYTAAAVAHAAGCPWIGMAGALAAGMLLALLHALLVLQLRVDAIISGVGLNLMALGLTTFLHRAGPEVAQVKGPGPWVPALAKVPVLGTLLGGGTPYVPLALLVTLFAWFVMYRTRAGLQLRAVGEAPSAARAAGVGVGGLRTCWLALGGALAGIGGSYLSLEAAGQFTENASAGKGYLALAAVIFGRWHPLGAAAAVLAFAVGEAVQIEYQGKALWGMTLSADILTCLPFIMGLLALAGVLGKVKPPAGLGQVG